MTALAVAGPLAAAALIVALRRGAAALALLGAGVGMLGAVVGLSGVAGGCALRCRAYPGSRASRSGSSPNP